MGLELVTGYRGRLHITAPQDADLYRGLFGDGRVTVGNNMDVTLTAPLEVTVLDGVCLLDGREFFVANEDSVSVECQFDSGTAYLCICYEKDESSGSETADFQILDTYNDMDIRNDPGASQKPLAKLTIEDGVITDIEMMVSMAEPIIDLSRETEDNLEKTDKALEEVDDTLTKINEYFDNLSALTERTEKAAEDAENAAERAETVAEDALTGVTVNDVPQEIVDHVVNIIAPDQEEMDKAVTDISALQTENAELKEKIAEMEEEISKLNTNLSDPDYMRSTMDSVINGGALESGNLDDFRQLGAVWVNCAVATGTLPFTSGYGTVLCFHPYGNTYVQIFFPYRTSNNLRFRTYTNSQWYDWRAA